MNFNLPISRIRSGWYSDKYFTRSRRILEEEDCHPQVVMQIFCKKEAVLCGVDEVLACLKAGSLNPHRLKVYALKEGCRIKPWETVMHIRGDYQTFVHLETLYLGILTRRTSVATAVRCVVDACEGKPVFFFSARFDHFLNQPGDGYAAKIGKATAVSTDASASWLDDKTAFGTIPHGLIAAFGGDTVKASLTFDRQMPQSIKRIVLVDFENDCVKTSLEVARALGRRLWAVRLDTSHEVKDRSVKARGFGSYGVCPELVRNVREALNRAGYPWVRIIISGGFDADRIRDFLRRRVPFDAVGVGSSFFRDRVEFTADIVKVNGQMCSKVGRKFKPNRRLQCRNF